ncbi:MAG: co-chaperone GroES [Deltaproteobacteria bacterium]|jgi:co-chaperonin GroES (HSP10)|nr:co-chaperone GroES [Deltaproteobacteria bacterium]
MKPIGKYIIIKSIKEELKTESGLLLSAQDASDFRYKKGEVIKEGTDVNVIKKGDIVYYDGAAGHQMLIEDNPYTIITERDVVVVL